ncbi:radical SAM protein [bacterium]|nr:radical SAM protein [bacterium]
MKSLGTKRIQFTGGEPLLRKDIGKIIDYCKKLGILTTVSASGVKVKEKIKKIKKRLK